MKIITKVKILLIVIIGIILFAMPANIFAAVDLNDYSNSGWENLQPEGGDEQPTPTIPTTPTTPSTTTPTTPSTNTSTTNKKETLPDAGLVEDTIMVVAIIVLGTVAIYAYGKINKYSNI